MSGSFWDDVEMTQIEAFFRRVAAFVEGRRVGATFVDDPFADRRATDPPHSNRESKLRRPEQRQTSGRRVLILRFAEVSIARRLAMGAPPTPALSSPPLLPRMPAQQLDAFLINFINF